MNEGIFLMSATNKEASNSCFGNLCGNKRLTAELSLDVSWNRSFGGLVVHTSLNSTPWALGKILCHSAVLFEMLQELGSFSHSTPNLHDMSKAAAELTVNLPGPLVVNLLVEHATYVSALDYLRRSMRPRTRSWHFFASLIKFGKSQFVKSANPLSA